MERTRNPAVERRVFAELTERSKNPEERGACLGPAVVGNDRHGRKSPVRWTSANDCFPHTKRYFRSKLMFAEPDDGGFAMATESLGHPVKASAAGLTLKRFAV